MVVYWLILFMLMIPILAIMPPSAEAEPPLGRNEAGWAIEVVDGQQEEPQDVGLCSSIALDSIGKVHISYRDVTNGVLKYASNAPGC